MSEQILLMSEITKTFPGTKALDGVDFDLNKGEVHALIGENGAGKSTLMNILVGIHKPDSGHIIIHGNEVTVQSPNDALKHGIGMVPQELNLVPSLSVAENIFLGNERVNKAGRIIDWKAARHQARDILSKLRVEIDVTQPVSTYSAAYQQLISIARLLAVGTDILIMDEPTAALTLKEIDHLYDVINDLREAGKSIIFITHHLEEVKNICDRVTVMRDGKIVYSDSVAETSIQQMIFYMANRIVEHKKAQINVLNNNVVLEVKNFSRKNEFNDISFQLHEGEILGIAGLVGSGRTELIQSIYGLTKNDSGELYFNGERLNVDSPSVSIKHGFGLIPEERRKHGIFPFLSVLDNMAIPSLKNYRKKRLINYKAINTMVEDYVEKFQIKTASNQTFIKNLSGGNQQKVVLARWIAKGIKVLILDEPTRGIDVNSKGEIHSVIRQLAKSGVSVIVVSSELDEIIQLADRILIMFEGESKGIVTKTDDLTQEKILEIALS